MNRFLKILGGVVKVLLGVFLAAAVALGILLSISAQRLPGFLSDRLEKLLCADAICVQFDSAAFSIRDGLTLRNLRLYAAGQLGPPLLAIEEVRVEGAFRVGSSSSDWLEAVHLRGLDFSELPDFDTLGVLFADAATDTEATDAYGWITRPVDLFIEDLTVLGTHIHALSTRVVYHDERFVMDDLKLRWPGVSNATEHAQGLAWFALPDSSWRILLEGRATPDPLYSIFRALDFEPIVDFCSRFNDFHDPLDTRFNLECGGGDAPVAMQLFLHGTNFRYKGIPVLEASAQVSLADDGDQYHLAVSDLRIKHASGPVEGSLKIDLENSVIDLDIRSNVDKEVMLVGSELEDTVVSNIVDMLSFQAPPTMVISGQVAFLEDDSVTADLRGHGSSGPFSLRDISIGEASSPFHVTELSLDFPDLKAQAFGGTIAAGIAIDRPDRDSDDWTAHLRGTIGKIRFGDCCRDLLGVTNNYGGILSTTFDLDLPITTNTFPQGTGTMKVQEGTIARIPLFAGFTDYLADTIPGVETLVNQSDIAFSFVCTNGQFRTDDLLVEGGFFSMRAGGAYTRRTDTLDFVARARLFREKTLVGRVTRFVTFPFSKFLEFRIYGTPANPQWSYIGLIDRIKGLFTGGNGGGDPAQASPPP